MKNTHGGVLLLVFPPDPRRREKINVNFYFQTSLWCRKRFYQGLKDLHKTVKAPQKKKNENKNLS